MGYDCEPHQAQPLCIYVTLPGMHLGASSGASNETNGFSQFLCMMSLQVTFFLPLLPLQMAQGAGDEPLNSQQKQARMWQLVRIMVRLFPASRAFLPPSTLNLSKQQVLDYLNSTLGDPESPTSAPHPEWGVPEGWPQFLANVLSWALDKPFTAEQVCKCMYQQNNRMWAVVGEWPCSCRLHRRILQPEARHACLPQSAHKAPAVRSYTFATRPGTCPCNDRPNSDPTLCPAAPCASTHPTTPPPLQPRSSSPWTCTRPPGPCPSTRTAASQLPRSTTP